MSMNISVRGVSQDVDPMEHLATTNNPFGIAPNLGGQWPEGRCFSRTLGRNPQESSRLIRTLIGLQDAVRTFIPNSDTRLENTIIVAENTLSLEGIRGVIGGLNFMCPEWRETAAVDRDLSYRSYQADELSINEVDGIIADGSYAVKDSRDSAEAFWRVYRNNPHATEVLLQNLYGLQASLTMSDVGDMGMKMGLRKVPDGELADRLKEDVRWAAKVVDRMLPGWRFPADNRELKNVLINRALGLFSYEPDERSIDLIPKFIDDYREPDPFELEMAMLNEGGGFEEL